MLTLAWLQDGQVVFGRSYSNVWVSNDGGQHWEQVTWGQPPTNDFDVPGSIGGWAVLDMAVAPVHFSGSGASE
ncbi:MAG: hypothetical protein JWO80_4379 [Bryobacterales bacterium]|nr:hypothetical protein [Bryobacterales bacterium]